jgi:hypothetical protein
MENDAPVVGLDVPTVNSKVVGLDIVAGRESVTFRIALYRHPGATRRTFYRLQVLAGRLRGRAPYTLQPRVSS